MSVERHDASRHFFWHELATTDPEAASDFYGAVLGWRALPLEEPGAEYWTWVPVHEGANTGATPGRGRGGLKNLSESPDGDSSSSAWQGYVWSPNPAGDAQRAESLGGRVVGQPHTVPSVGRMIVVEDPLGARITLMSPYPPKERESGTTPRSGGRNDRLADELETGRFAWQELAISDPDTALDFYGKLLGWTVTASVELQSGEPYRIFGSHGVELGGILHGRHDDTLPSQWLYSILVGNLDEALRRVGKSGGEVLHGPTEAPRALIAYCRDPQGAHFALRQESEVRPTT